MKGTTNFWNQCTVIFTAVFLLLGAVACDRQEAEKEENTIKLAYANWSEGVAMTHLVSVVLEEELGYEVITKMADIESVFELLDSEEYDVFVDAWLPGTHGNYMDEYGESLEDLGVNVEQVKTGLVVPNYVEAQSIADLEGSMEQIVGIAAGAGVMQATNNALDTYNLSLTLKEGSEQSMADELMEAIKRREPVVVTGWTPHWLYNRYDLKFLEDPKNVYGDSEKIHTIARQNFTDDHPRLALFFERFKLTEQQLGSLMDEVVTLPDNPERAVNNWIEDHQLIVNKWVRGLQPEREKVM